MKFPTSLQEHIRELEGRLLRPEVRRSSQTLDELLGDEFIEFASDGTAYDKIRVIAALQAESLYQRSITEFRLVALAEDLMHATYRLTKRGDTSQESTVSLRSSIWKERDGRWQLIFKAPFVWRSNPAVNTGAPSSSLRARRGSAVTLIG